MATLETNKCRRESIRTKPIPIEAGDIRYQQHREQVHTHRQSLRLLRIIIHSQRPGLAEAGVAVGLLWLILKGELTSVCISKTAILLPYPAIYEELAGISPKKDNIEGDMVPAYCVFASGRAGAAIAHITAGPA